VHFTSLTLAEDVRKQGAVPTTDEVTAERRRLHKKVLYDLDSSQTIIQVIKSKSMRWSENVARMGEKRGAYRVFVGRPEETRSLGIPRRIWKSNNKMDLQEEENVGMAWINLAQHKDKWQAFVNAVMRGVS
jgi:hypothetical protein